MQNREFVFACTPDEAAEIRALGAREGRLGYRISANGRLFYDFPARPDGGVLILSDDGAGRPEPEVFDRMLEAELARGRFEGIFADLEGFHPALSALVGRLEAIAARRRLALYVPELYAPQAQTAFVLTGSDVIAGSFELRLSEQAQRYGERAALELVPVRAEFILPAEGKARALSEQALDALLARGAQPFFSSELSLNYFTYREKETTRFVVFDDAHSLRRKIGIAESLGVRRVFALYREMRALLPDILVPDGAY